MSEQDMEQPREDDRNDELDESPAPDPEETADDDEDVPVGPSGGPAPSRGTGPPSASRYDVGNVAPGLSDSNSFFNAAGSSIQRERTY